MKRAYLLPATPIVALGMVLGSLTATATAVVVSALDDKPAFAQGKEGPADPCLKPQVAAKNPQCVTPI